MIRKFTREQVLVRFGDSKARAAAALALGSRWEISVAAEDALVVRAVPASEPLASGLATLVSMGCAPLEWSMTT